MPTWMTANNLALTLVTFTFILHMYHGQCLAFIIAQTALHRSALSIQHLSPPLSAFNLLSFLFPSLTTPTECDFDPRDRQQSLVFPRSPSLPIPSGLVS